MKIDEDNPCGSHLERIDVVHSARRARRRRGRFLAGDDEADTLAKAERLASFAARASA